MSKKPKGYAWGGTMNIVLRDIGPNCDSPMWTEWNNGNGFVDRLECDSDQYVANRYVERRLQYEEIDRYPTTMALRYGM